jgi:cold shock protein
MATGTVKWFDERKGIGFIVSDTDGDDLFVHQSEILGESNRVLVAGEKVDFETIKDLKGPNAIHVRKSIPAVCAK